MPGAEPQHTLAADTDWLVGRSLDSGAARALRLHPAPIGHGVHFLRADLPRTSAAHIRCDPRHLRPQPRWTSLEQDGVWVHHTEHVLAALGGMGVDNAVVELDGPWVPVLQGGSCAALCAAIRAVGLVAQDAPRRRLRLTRPVCFEAELPPPPGVAARAAVGAAVASGRSAVIGVPDEHLSVTFTFHVPALPTLRSGVGEYHHGVDDFASTLGAARSFELAAAPLSATGWAEPGPEGGVAAALGLLTLGAATSQAETDEIARHKALDLLGDLMVLGALPVGRFLALRSGHRLQHRLVQQLASGDYLSAR